MNVVNPSADAAIADTLGGFANIAFEYGEPSRTCRLDPTETRLICLAKTLDTTGNPLGGRMWADSLVIYDRDRSRRTQTVDIQTPLRTALLQNGDLDQIEVDWVNPTNSLELDIQNHDGMYSGLLKVTVTFEYNSTRLPTTDPSGSPMLGKDWGVAMLALIENDNGYVTNVEVIPLSNGAMAFLAFPNIGTWSNETENTIYKVQYAPAEPCQRRALITGVQRFEDRRTGTAVMAYTHLYERSTVIVTDPWRVSGPIRILQRFGSPMVFDPDTSLQPRNGNPAYRYFGVSEEEDGLALYGGLFNVWHTTYPSSNLDTITVFNCGAPDDVFGPTVLTNGRIYEFAVNLKPQGENAALVDSVFNTAYRRVDLDFWNEYMGGARPLEVGLYVTTSGKLTSSGFTGLKVADTNGGIKELSLASDNLCLDALYDSFIFLEIDPRTGSPIQSTVQQNRHRRHVMGASAIAEVTARQKHSISGKWAA